MHEFCTDKLLIFADNMIFSPFNRLKTPFSKIGFFGCFAKITKKNPDICATTQTAGINSVDRKAHHK